MSLSADVGTLLISGATALLVTLILVPITRRLAEENRIIDQPGGRRVNTSPIPRLGGLAISIGIFAGALLAYVLINFAGFQPHELSFDGSLNYLGITAGVLTMFIIGLLDDLLDLRARHKLFGQIIAATLIMLSGVLLSRIEAFGATVEFGYFRYPLTVFLLVAFSNVINLIDGLDGLSSGLVLLASSLGLYIAINTGEYASALIFTLLIASCAAFLVFNKFPASIFMGDSGAMSLGLLFGIAAILLMMPRPTLNIGLAVLMPMSIPIIDTFTAIVRRIHLGTRVGNADTSHIHHRFLFKYGHGKAVTYLHLYTAAFLILGIIEYIGPLPVKAGSVFVATAVSLSLIIRYRLLSAPMPEMDRGVS